jgi:hypothetical protein
MTEDRRTTPLTSFAVYDAEGAFLRKGVARNPEAQAGTGETVFENVAAPEDKWLVDGVLRPLPKAIRDVRAAQQMWQRIRARRAGLFLSGIDSLNPLRWEAMDETQKQAWREYRQALRDIPQVFATPEDVIWPEPPE